MSGPMCNRCERTTAGHWTCSQAICPSNQTDTRPTGGDKPDILERTAIRAWLKMSNPGENAPESAWDLRLEAIQDLADLRAVITRLREHHGGAWEARWRALAQVGTARYTEGGDRTLWRDMAEVERRIPASEGASPVGKALTLIDAHTLNAPHNKQMTGALAEIRAALAPTTTDSETPEDA